MDTSDDDSSDGLSDDEIGLNDDDAEEEETRDCGPHLRSSVVQEEREASKILANSLRSQKELIYNKFLPYSDVIDEESKLRLVEIKANLGRAVLLRELKPGCYYWTLQLSTYVTLYGLKFTKSDHVTFVRLLYELVTVPDLDLSLVLHFSGVLTILLRKRIHLSRSDLVLPWKPLYDVYHRVCFSHYAKIRTIRIPRIVSLAIVAVVRVARTYFPVESTAEMLAEWRPWLCPFVRKHTKKAMDCFELFLPVLVDPMEHELSFRLWFDEFVQFWLSCQSNPIWESNMMMLFSRLAQENVGYIDWNPFIPTIFTRLLRSLQLPITMKQVRLQNTKSAYCLNAIAVLLVSMLGGNSKCQEHLTQLFRTLKSFYHPSNNGSWNSRLQTLLSKLSTAMMDRIKRERQRGRVEWIPEVPKESRLTEEDITDFVLCLKPCVLLSMFSKSGCRDAAAALKNLAILRPEFVVPSVLERFYPAVERLTEPHRLLTVIQCLTHVSVPLVRGGKEFPDGPSHVLKILNCCLPAIDPNDANKSLMMGRSLLLLRQIYECALYLSTFQLLISLLGQIPLVDCSQMVADFPNMSEADRELCFSTCQFEDFVLQFLDRCFVLVENSALESCLVTDGAYDTVTFEEEQLQRAMKNAFGVILLQSSPEIFQVAVRKLYNFVNGRVMGIKDAGYMVAKLVRATVQKDGYGVRLFLPSVVRVIDENMEDECSKSDPGNELLFNLLLLHELVCCDGRILLSYRDPLLAVLKKVVQLTDKDGHSVACNILKNLLTRLTTVYYSEYGATSERNGADRLPIKDWGQTVDLKTLEIPWHTGSAAETEFAQQLVDTFLTGELTKLSDMCDERVNLSRCQLLQSLAVVYSCLMGCLSICPSWDDDIMPVSTSVVRMEAVQTALGSKEAGTLTLGSGKNIRKEVATFIRRLTQFLLEKHEDNTLAFRYVIKIYLRLLFYWGTHYDSYEQDLKGWLKAKRIVDNPIERKRKYFRMLFIQRVSFQHLTRALECGLNVFSKLHVEIMQDLLQLSLSHYSEVRIQAQCLLGECFKVFVYSYKHLLPQLSTLVQNTSQFEHHKLKGLLHLLLGKQVTYCLLTRRELRTLDALWPVVITTTISDKPSINALLDELVDAVDKQMETFAIVDVVPQSTLNAARSLWSSVSNSSLSSEQPSEEEISAACVRLAERNAANVCVYHDMIGNLVNLLEKPNLHWQNLQFGLDLLFALIRPDVAFPPKAVQLILGILLDVSPAARKIASSAMLLILEQLKRRVPHVEVDPEDVAGQKNCNLYYDANTVPSTKEEWDATLFVDKPHLGFYRWPRYLHLHEPPGRHSNRWPLQPDMSEAESSIHDFFSSPSNVESLVQFLSSEGNKDHDKLDHNRCHLFKLLFRNYGEAFLPMFKPHLERMVIAREDSSKRCALEIICGLVAGSKHWSFEMLSRLWTYLSPLVKLALSRVNVEIQTDWSRGVTYMASNRDPRRMKWLLEILTEDLLVSSEGSFLEANRLLLLVSALSEQPWRLSNVLCNVMDTVAPHLAHPYQNIRDELGRVLSQLFLTNTELQPFSNGHGGPVQSVFVENVLSKLNTFDKMMQAVASGGSTMGSNSHRIPDDDPEWKSSVALLKTVCRWLRRRIFKTLQWTSSDLFRLLPILCVGDTCDRDPELQVNCRMSIAIMAHSYLPNSEIEAAIDTVEAVSNSISWRSRRTSIEYLQVLIFSNLFVVLQWPKCMGSVRRIVLRLLQDVRPEVQQMAALALSGMFHSEILKFDQVLLDTFTCLSKTDVRRKRQGTSTTDEVVDDAVQRRHAGILGLCAFVGAHPYDVVERMPEVLVILGDHLHDPQPLQGTVRTSLSNFWRTHRDNWHDHKLSFTDDQLSVLTDLLISPNYYA